MENLAPVILFVYNRPDKTYETLQALKKNHFAEESDLYIFSDGARDSSQIENVNKVRKIISEVKGFKRVRLFLEENNKGLANSVIDGVSQIIRKHEKVIVLEDDLITSKFFLRYMNEGLNYYQKNSDIWSMSGYTPSINLPDDYHERIYITPRGCSWGWGTWRDRWEKIDWQIADYEKFKKDGKAKKQFNKSGNDMCIMLENQMKGFIDSWAIRWCYNQFQRGSYTIYPTVSFVENTGITGESTHGSLSNRYSTTLIENYDMKFKDLPLNEKILKEFSSFYHMNLTNYIGIIFRYLGVYKQVKKVIKKVIVPN
ncbi:sugar transferase [Priestia megaterium]